MKLIVVDDELIIAETLVNMLNVFEILAKPINPDTLLKKLKHTPEVQ